MPVTVRQPGVSWLRGRGTGTGGGGDGRGARRCAIDVGAGSINRIVGTDQAKSAANMETVPCTILSQELDRPESAARSHELLSIFFPMWNEQDYVERAIDSARAVCDDMVVQGLVADYELIIVDDQSTDRTPAIADALAAADPRVRVVHHAVNRKLGGSIKTGFATARGDLVLYSDADLPFDFQELPRAIRLMRHYGADLLSAYRFDRTGEGYTRAIYTFFYNLLIRTMFGVKARDINFAFKICNRAVLDKITLRATRSGFELLQFGVDYFPRTRGQSTLSSLGVITTILKEMYGLRGELGALKHPAAALAASDER